MPIIVKSNLSKQLTHFLKSKLLKEELVVLPTETVYGLAGLGTNIKAAKKIFPYGAIANSLAAMPPK